MADADRERWDRHYASRDRHITDHAALPAVFASSAGLFPTIGSAIELACGTGAAAVWLALRGLRVWACDISPVAVAAATERARLCGVAHRCTFEVVDLDHGVPAPGPVDVLLCSMFRDPQLDGALVERLAPGGLLAVSALSEVGAAPGRFRAGAGELLRAFGALDVIGHGEADGRAWLLGRRRGLPQSTPQTHRDPDDRAAHPDELL